MVQMQYRLGFQASVCAACRLAPMISVIMYVFEFGANYANLRVSLRRLRVPEGVPAKDGRRTADGLFGMRRSEFAQNGDCRWFSAERQRLVRDRFQKWLASQVTISRRTCGENRIRARSEFRGQARGKIRGSACGEIRRQAGCGSYSQEI